MQDTKTNQYGAPSIGCHLDHAHYNTDELSTAIVELAIEFGYEPGKEDSALVLCSNNHWLNDDASQALYEASEEAIEWLNGQETRSHLYWANEGEAGAFGLWPNIDGAKEDCEFISSKENEYPPKDFAGEWLHVNDHGNCTLYVRDGQGNDKEIWSVV